MLPTAGENVWGKLLTSVRQEELFSLSRHFFQITLDCYSGLVWLNYRIFLNLIHTLFYSFRGLKIRCGLDSRSRDGFWKNDTAAVYAVRTIQYINLLLIRFAVITHNWIICVLCIFALQMWKTDDAKLPFNSWIKKKKKWLYFELMIYDKYRGKNTGLQCFPMVTSNIIQSVTLWARGVWRKGAD
jgi:hypothetical protein